VKTGRFFTGLRFASPSVSLTKSPRLLSIGVTVTFLVLLVMLMAPERLVDPSLVATFLPADRSVTPLPTRKPVPMMKPQTGFRFSESTTDEFKPVERGFEYHEPNLQAQFLAQRQFTDNAAHEMQTPLAILGHELENLLDIEPLSMEQVTGIERAQDSIRRLVRLNKSLLLLTRIENHQFAGEDVNVTLIVDELARVYQDFASHHGLKWEYDLAPDIHQTMNPYLAEVLFSNLMPEMRYATLSRTPKWK
jgi:signal transduction histidine kinase